MPQAAQFFSQGQETANGLACPHPCSQKVRPGVGTAPAAFHSRHVRAVDSLFLAKEAALSW
jgi:hypothetical protein